MSRRSATSLIGTGREPERASSAIAKTAYRDFEVTEITGTLYRKQARIGTLTDPKRCLIAGIDPLTTFAIQTLLQGSHVVESVASRREALELIQNVDGFDVTVIAYGHTQDDGEGDGLGAIRAVRMAEPALGIVAFGPHAQRHFAQAAMQAGANAYVSAESAVSSLAEAIRHAQEGESFADPALPPKGRRGPLTQRQRQILEILADGQSAHFAAESLGLSEETVKTHTKNMLARLGARNRAHAVAIAIRRGLIS
jgi:DNA-binding NarL/FixJ family response regulator